LPFIAGWTLDSRLPRSAFTETLMETFMETRDLRKLGLKVTHPRMRVLDLLEQSRPRHMTAEDIYRKLTEEGDEIGLATVYRVLTQFEAAGLVLKHNFEGGHAVYELDRGEHHDHMVDIDTGKIIEFESDEIEALQHKIAAEYGYEIEAHALVLYVRKKK
jgi:Fur family transcriptional regulator, ferric uptake regulator